MSQKYKLISFVVPVLNEQDSLRQLIDEILAVAPSMPCDRIEIIFVDDGSTDGSWSVIQEISAKNPESVRGVRLRRNFGKTLAINAGVKATSGEIIFLMDADLQDNPSEIPKFLAKIDEGFDLVVGWKVDRKDPWHKTLPSLVFNYMTSRLTSLRLHDVNCGFKCFRAEVFETISLHGEMHRFIPVIANDLGFTVAEVPVDHRSRKHGASKYGFERFLRHRLADRCIHRPILVKTGPYIRRPGHFYRTGRHGHADLPCRALVPRPADRAPAALAVRHHDDACLAAVQLNRPAVGTHHPAILADSRLEFRDQIDNGPATRHP